MSVQTPCPRTQDRTQARDVRLIWLALLLGWVMLATASRVAVSPVLSWDQAEQAVWSQALAWGYGPQPPLYTWLQRGVNAVLGMQVLSFAAVKHALMALGFVAMYAAARQILPARTAVLVALSLWCLPGFMWEALRDMTHTVLLSTTVCTSWWLLLRQIRQPSRWGFVALGVVMAVGMLAKYSYLLIGAAALLAALSLPIPRRALCSRGWWLAPLVAAVLVAPHALWVWGNWQAASAATLAKMQPADAAAGWRGLLDGAGDVLGLVTGTVLCLALLLSWAYGRRWLRAQTDSPTRVEPSGADAVASTGPGMDAPPPWAVPLLLRYFGLIALAIVGMLLVGVTHFDGRWIHPMVCVLPLLVFAARPALGRDLRGARRLVGATVALVLVLAAVVWLDPMIDARRGHSDRFNWPAEQMAHSLRAAGYDGRSLIVADNHMLGGLLRLQFPQAPVAVCNDELDESPACVKAWGEAMRAQGRSWLLVAVEDPVDDAWWQAARGGDGLAPAAQSAPQTYRWARQGAAPLRFEWVWLPAR